MLWHQLRVGKTTFHKIAKSVSVDIFSQMFFKPTLLALKRTKIRLILCLDSYQTYLGVYIDAGTLGSCQITVKCLYWVGIFGRFPNPRANMYPQMGSEKNIKSIFGGFSASRVGFKKIPRKNINGNWFYEVAKFLKKKYFFFQNVTAMGTPPLSLIALINPQLAVSWQK